MATTYRVYGTYGDKEHGTKVSPSDLDGGQEEFDHLVEIGTLQPPSAFPELDKDDDEAQVRPATSSVPAAQTPSNVTPGSSQEAQRLAGGSGTGQPTQASKTAQSDKK